MSERELPDWLVERLRTAPRSPGCYLMRGRPRSGDEAGEVVYVGKAKDLKARLSQYFAPNPGDTRFFVGLLDRVLGSIDLIVAGSDKEALILENDLIKEYQPRFNVKLKDDKNFLNIRIGRDHPYPRLEVVRKQRRDGADYFGPYDSASAIRNTLRVINRHFRLRTCRDTEFRNRVRPCLEHQIGRCPAPCVLDVAEEDYAESVQEVKLFLRGQARPLVSRLKSKMARSADRLDFELAAHYRDQIAAIERSLQPQAVRLPQAADVDVFGLHREGPSLVMQALRLRSGVITNTRGFPMSGVELPDEEVLEDFIAAFYDGSRPVPDLVITPLPLEEEGTWAEILSDQRGKKVEVRFPQRGAKKRLLEMAQENARETFRVRVDKEQDALETLQRLQERLVLRNFPRRIECYDISNIQGTEPVGSMVVALDGQLAKREYRHYKIRSLTAPNDFQMMYEVLSRRFRKGLKTGELPDLIVIDGGKGQLNVAAEVLDELGIVDVDVASLAKQRMLDAQGHVARGQSGLPSSDDPDKSPERVFRPGRKNPVKLRAGDSGLFLLQRLRDEAHRFAITHHKKLRRKRTLVSELDDVPGIGPARRTALLTHFGSLSKVREATREELMACPGISEGLAEAIREALR